MLLPPPENFIAELRRRLVAAVPPCDDRWPLMLVIDTVDIARRHPLSNPDEVNVGFIRIVSVSGGRVFGFSVRGDGALIDVVNNTDLDRTGASDMLFSLSGSVFQHVVTFERPTAHESAQIVANFS